MADVGASYSHWLITPMLPWWHGLVTIQPILIFSQVLIHLSYHAMPYFVLTTQQIGNMSRKRCEVSEFATLI